MRLFDFLFRRKPKKIKLGLALGSGGAKGFAELGALKAFEENGLDFEIVAGTSIGSIVGAFYAQGYTSTDILEMLKKIDPNEIKTLLMMNMDTAGLWKVIDRYIGSLDIKELKKTFRAVATDTDSGKEKVFAEGNVAKVLCASASFPPFFKPVEIDGKRYIDGAFTNSVPADVVRELGADYVIGIDLKNHDDKPSIFAKILPSYQSGEKEPWKKGYEHSDVMLHPDLSNYKSVSFGDADVMFEIGYQSAMLYMPKILQDIEALKKKKKK